MVNKVMDYKKKSMNTDREKARREWIRILLSKHALTSNPEFAAKYA
jgi:hypothetical protein